MMYVKLNANSWHIAHAQYKVASILATIVLGRTYPKYGTWILVTKRKGC